MVLFVSQYQGYAITYTTHQNVCFGPEMQNVDRENTYKIVRIGKKIWEGTGFLFCSGLMGIQRKTEKTSKLKPKAMIQHQGSETKGEI